MWAAIIDKFQCCLNPEKINNNKTNHGPKEVVLDKLDEKKPALMKKKTIKHSNKKSDFDDTDGSFLNKINQNENEVNTNNNSNGNNNIANNGNNYSSQDDSKSANKLIYSKTLKKRKSSMKVSEISETRKDLLNNAFGNQ